MKTNIPAFTQTKIGNADDKAKFTGQFIKFVTGGFQQKDFPKWFYNRLSQCRGHIAHYNQGGFWEEWFADKTSQNRFLAHWATEPIYGAPEYTYSDVERFLQTWIQDSGLLERVQSQAEEEKNASNFRTAQAAFNALPENMKKAFLLGVQ